MTEEQWMQMYRAATRVLQDAAKHSGFALQEVRGAVFRAADAELTDSPWTFHAWGEVLVAGAATGFEVSFDLDMKTPDGDYNAALQKFLDVSTATIEKETP